MELIWWAIIFGLGIGSILSAIFGIYSKKGLVSYSRNIFGIQSTDLITDSIIFLVATSFVFLTSVSILVRDVTYPKGSPLNFTFETLLMAFLPSCIIFAMSLLRGFPITGQTFEEFGILSIKFGLLHILLQFSGFYSYVFPPV
jgi:hypothetical protein